MIGPCRFVAAAFALVAFLLASGARALVWPDVAERIEEDLGAADVATRRAAARGLASLGPKRGAPLSVAALGDADDEVRLAAADAAIRLHARGATEAALGWLNAPDPRFRKKACDLARALPNRRAVALLARTLGDPDAEVRSGAAAALGRQESADAVPALLGRLDDRAPAVRIQIAESLARLGDARAVVPLVSKVQDSSPDVRQAVTRALGDLGSASASPALALALRDQSADVRREALAALGRLRAADAVDAIAPFAMERTPSLRVAALTALAAIGTPDAVRILVGTLGLQDDATSSLARSPPREALVRAGALVIPALRELLSGAAAPAAAASAAWVLGELHARSEAPTLVAAIRRGTLPATAGLHALAGAGTAAEVPIVLEFVDDGNPAVRSEAIGAAMALLEPQRPDGRVVEPLAAALRDPRCSAQDRARIARLLGRTGAPRAAPLLVELTKGRDTTLRLAAIDALGTLGPSGAEVDDALMGGITSPEASVRLHAALALSQSGTSRARESLLKLLNNGDEVDRPTLLTALGGALARAPTDEAVAHVVGVLELAAGPERDALIEAVGSARLPSAIHALASLGVSHEPADRRAAATLLAGHAGDGRALAVARAMLTDADPSVRAQAAWTLGTLGDGADVARLESIARSDGGADPDPAIDATAAIGRIAARARGPELDTLVRLLCDLASEARAYVRANALAGIGAARARCAGGSFERGLLQDDPSESVRAAAASAISERIGPNRSVDPTAGDDRRALERCAHDDPSGAVAARCARGAARAEPSAARAMLVYVVPDSGTTPIPGSEYAVLLGDGMIRVGTTDRRGAVFDPVAPLGEVSLRQPSALAR